MSTGKKPEKAPEATPSPPDLIDEIREEWAKEAPRVDTTPIDIIGRMQRLHRIWSPYLDSLCRRNGVSRADYDILATLCRRGPPYEMQPVDICWAVGVGAGTLGRQLKELRTKGFLTRRPGREDLRSSLIQLAPKGRELALRMVEEEMEMERQWLHALTAPQRAALADLLRPLLAAHTLKKREKGAPRAPTVRLNARGPRGPRTTNFLNAIRVR